MPDVPPDHIHAANLVYLAAHPSHRRRAPRAPRSNDPSALAAWRATLDDYITGIVENEIRDEERITEAWAKLIEREYGSTPTPVMRPRTEIHWPTQGTRRRSAK